MMFSKNAMVRLRPMTIHLLNNFAASRSSVNSGTFGESGRGETKLSLKLRNGVKRTSKRKGNREQPRTPSTSADTFGKLGSPVSVEQSMNRLHLKRSESKNSKLLMEDDETQFVDSDETDVGSQFIPFVKKRDPNWYVKQCSMLAEAGKIRESVAMLETRMLQVDKVWPTHTNFQVVLRYLGRDGFVKKAFELHQLMVEKYNLTRSASVYTSLFNACANSPYRGLALLKAQDLRSTLLIKGTYVNKKTCHAMIKAFARLGDLQTCFLIADEMVKNKWPISVTTYSHLLHACISDKNNGFQFMIMIWQKMISKGVLPDIYSFNLVLQTCKLCGIGPVTTLNEFTVSLPKLYEPPKKKKSIKSIPQIGATKSVTWEAVWKSIRTSFNGFLTADQYLDIDNDKNLGSRFDEVGEQVGEGNDDHMLDALIYVKGFVPNDAVVAIDRNNSDTGSVDVVGSPNSSPSNLRLSDRHHPQSGTDLESPKVSSSASFNHNPLRPGYRVPTEVVALGDMSSANNRFELIGGLDGFMQLMKEVESKPTIKTFTMILEILPVSAVDSEKALLQHMASLDVSPDTDFINFLMKRCTIRKDPEGAQGLMSVLKQFNLEPNMTTFNCISYTCKNRAEALECIASFENHGLEPNLAVMTTLMNNALFRKRPYWVLQMLQIISDKKIDVDKKFLLSLDSKITKMKELLIQAQTQKDASGTANDQGFYSTEQFRIGIKKLTIYYNNWLRQTRLLPKKHPWSEMEKPVDIDSLREDWEKPWEKEQSG